MPTIYNQNFESGSLPSGWNFDAGFTIDTTSKLTATNSLSISTTTTSGAIYGTLDGVSGNASEGLTVAVYSPGTNSQIRIQTRLASATDLNANHYRANVNFGSAPSSWTIIKRSGGVDTTLYTSSGALNTAITAGTLLAAATAYRAYLTANGGSSPGTVVTLELQRVSDSLWLTGTGTWQATRTTCMSVLDSSSPIVGQGYAGFGTALASGAPAYFDDFSIDDNFDPTTYTKFWTDLSGFANNSGGVSVAAGIFNGGADAGLVLPGVSGLVVAYSDFNDRQYGNTLTGHFLFKQADYNASQASYFLIRGLRLLVSANSSVIKLQGYGGTPDYASVPFSSSTYVDGRIYDLYFRVDGSTAKFALKDTVTGNRLQSSGGTFTTTKVWCINYTLAAPPTPGAIVGFANVSASGSTLWVGPLKFGPCGTPQVTPSSATLATGATQAFTPLYFTGVDTVNSVTAGTFSGNTYTAPGTTGTETLTFASTIGGESVDVPLTVSSASSSFAIEGSSSTDLIGQSTALASFAIVGSSTANLIGQSTVLASLSIVGSSSSNFIGQSTATSTLAIEGSSSTNWIGQSTVLASFAIEGSSSTNFVGQSIVIGQSSFSIEGSSSVNWIGQSIALSSFAIEGSSTANFVAESGSYFELDLVTFLNTNGITVYPNRIPQTVTSYPAIAFRISNTERAYKLNGPTGLVQASVDFEVLSKNYKDGARLSDRLRRLLVGTQFQMASTVINACLLEGQTANYGPPFNGSDVGMHSFDNSYLFCYSESF